MIGGVSDMNTVTGITPEWLEQKLQKVEDIDVYVADANLPVDSLAYLIDHLDKPLYVDAVSKAKAPKIAAAIKHSKKKRIHTVKCNLIEADSLLNQKVSTNSLSAWDPTVSTSSSERKRTTSLPCLATPSMSQAPATPSWLALSTSVLTPPSMTQLLSDSNVPKQPARAPIP